MDRAVLRAVSRWLLAVAWLAGAGCDDSTDEGGGGGGSSSSGLGGNSSGGSSGGGGAGGSGGGGGGSSATCGGVLLQENFIDGELAARGWTGGLSGDGYAVVSDADLGHNAFEFGFQQGDLSPGSSINHELGPSEDITITYKLRVGPSWELTVPHHLIMMHSNRDVSEGNGSPANAFGSTYFEWEWDDPGVFIGKFQDNRAINCDFDPSYQDLTEITEDRSVGGYQTWYAPNGQETTSWGDPCEGGLDSYTGQSVLTLHANGAVHPMTKDEWWQLAIHLRMNSIQDDKGIWDGVFQVELRGPGDSSPVRVMDFENVLWRAGGWSRDLAWAKFMMAPYLHDGATGSMWVRIADIMVREGDCLGVE